MQIMFDILSHFLLHVLRFQLLGLTSFLLLFQAEMAEMKTQMSLVTHQVDQLREQNSYKDAALLKERHENQQLVKNIDNYKVTNSFLMFCLCFLQSL